MNPGRRFSAIGTVLLICSAGFYGDPAYAFGEQWRPVAGYPPHQARDPWLAAPVPAFRPRHGATAVVQEPVDYRVRQPARYPAARPGYAATPYTSPAAMPIAYGYPVRPWYYPPQPGPFPGAAYPAWTHPFGEMTQPWQHQAPMFARQFAWRPAEQPWMAPTSDRRPADRGWTSSPRGVVPSFAPGYGAADAGSQGGWRPVPAGAPFLADRRYAAPVYAAPQQYGFSAWRPVSRSMVDAGPDGWNPAPAGPSRHVWRPQPAVSANSWAPNRGFRPQAYGRSPAPDQRMLARDETRPGHAFNALPGWVTTYEETDYSDGCAWCSGS